MSKENMEYTSEWENSKKERELIRRVREKGENEEAVRKELWGADWEQIGEQIGKQIGEQIGCKLWIHFGSKRFRVCLGTARSHDLLHLSGGDNWHRSHQPFHKSGITHSMCQGH